MLCELFSKWQNEAKPRYQRILVFPLVILFPDFPCSCKIGAFTTRCRLILLERVWVIWGEEIRLTVESRETEIGQGWKGRKDGRGKEYNVCSMVLGFYVLCSMVLSILFCLWCVCKVCLYNTKTGVVSVSFRVCRLFGLLFCFTTRILSSTDPVTESVTGEKERSWELEKERKERHKWTHWDWEKEGATTKKNRRGMYTFSSHMRQNKCITQHRRIEYFLLSLSLHSLFPHHIFSYTRVA